MGLDTIEPAQSENIFLTPSSSPITVLGTADATGKIGSWDPDILNLLEKQA